MIDSGERPRWQYRFDNFSRAYVLLREAIEAMDERELSQLEREGIIQRFEYTWELAWKTLKDYLDYQGIVLASVTPKAVLRAAYKAEIIFRGDDWMAALDARNKMSHTYDFGEFEKIIADIRACYLSLFDALYEKLLSETLKSDWAG